MRQYKIFHETIYRYSVPVELGPHKLLTRPREGHDIRIASATLSITPVATVRWHRDEFDNSVAIASFEDLPTNVLTIVSEAVITHYDEWPLDFLVEDHAVIFPFAYNNDEHLALSPYLRCELWEDAPLFDSWLARFNQAEYLETYQLLRQISDAIKVEHQYRVREEPGVQSAETTLAQRSGSCRDFAWLFMCTVRRLGLAARFVSGYLHAPATEFDYGATHAWAEVYLPGAGWKGIDPTVGQISGIHHIPTSVAIDPQGVPPVSGSYTCQGSTSSSLSVRVKVESLQAL